MSETPKVLWLPKPEKHDYPAAFAYLNLIYKEELVEKIVYKLKKASVVSFKAKDIFRASSLSLLGISNGHVYRDREKITNGTGLSPLLLVRDSLNGKLIIADGYHRLCAVYSFDEDAVIPCKIV